MKDTGLWEAYVCVINPSDLSKNPQPPPAYFTRVAVLLLSHFPATPLCSWCCFWCSFVVVFGFTCYVVGDGGGGADVAGSVCTFFYRCWLDGDGVGNVRFPLTPRKCEQWLLACCYLERKLGRVTSPYNSRSQRLKANSTHKNNLRLTYSKCNSARLDSWSCRS